MCACPRIRWWATVNRGWDVAKYLLTHEREMISASGQGAGGGRALGRGAGRTDRRRA